MTPPLIFLRSYYFVFAADIIIFFIAPRLIRPGFAVLGAMVAAFGTCLALNLFGMPQEMAEKMTTSRSVPAVYASVRFAQFCGCLFAVFGTLFAVQAAFNRDF